MEAQYSHTDNLKSNKGYLKSLLCYGLIINKTYCRKGFEYIIKKENAFYLCE